MELILGSMTGGGVNIVGKNVGRTATPWACPTDGMNGKFAGIPYPGLFLWNFQWDCTWVLK